MDISAPGTDIFGASVTRSILYFEGFETGAPGWVAGAEPGNFSTLPWSIWVDNTFNSWLTDSVDPFFFQQINYQSVTNTWASSPLIDLTSSIGPQLSFTALYDLEYFFDFLLVEASVDGTTWDLLKYRTGIGVDSSIKADLSRYEGQSVSSNTISPAIRSICSTRWGCH